MTADSNGYVGFDLALFIAEKLRAQFVFDMARRRIRRLRRLCVVLLWRGSV